MAQINSIAGRYRNPVSGGGLMPTRFTRSTIATGATISADNLINGLVDKTPTTAGGTVTLPNKASVRAALKNEVDGDSFSCTIYATPATGPAAPANFVTVANSDFDGYVGASAKIMAGASGTFLFQIVSSTSITITRVG